MVYNLKTRSCNCPYPKCCFWTSNIISLPIKPIFSFHRHRYTIYYYLISSRQKIVSKALPNPRKGKQVKSTLYMYSSITIDIEHKPQRHKPDKKRYTRQNSIYNSNSPSNNPNFYFFQTFRIKKGKLSLI